MALLHIERAASGLTGWETAHAWLSAVGAGDISAGQGACLYHGAPALAFALHAAAASRPGQYERALAALDASVTAITQQRLDRAHARVDRKDRPVLAEFDLIRGLTGLGAHHMRRDPDGDLIKQVLSYLVRLTEPLRADDLPGWWTDQAPTGTRTAQIPGGHGNFGMAHGIAGPLALLSLAIKAGITVAGHEDAINRICRWLDQWQQDGTWWPETITVDEARRSRPQQTRPRRPSWCYGTPGLARALQLTGQVTGDHARQQTAETALTGCLTDPAQTGQLTGTGLCHGSAGLFQTAWRIAADARKPTLAAYLPALAARLLAQDPASRTPSGSSTVRRARHSRCTPQHSARPHAPAGTPASCSADTRYSRSEHAARHRPSPPRRTAVGPDQHQIHRP